MTLRNACGNDAAQILSINRAFPMIAKHSDYLVWCACTMFASRSTVLENATGNVCGYILSLPLPSPSSEFLFQVALEENARGSSAAKELLRWYYTHLRSEGIKTSFTSVHRENRRGRALVRIARWLDVKYEVCDWPHTQDTVGAEFLRGEPLLVASL